MLGTLDRRANGSLPYRFEYDAADRELRDKAWATCPACGGERLKIENVDGIARIDCLDGCARTQVLDGLGPIEPMRPRLEPLSTRALCALPEPATDAELVGPLLMRGTRLVLGGHTGEGKTTLSLQLVAAVAHGRDFLGYATQHGRALVIDAEQGLRTIKRRLREAALDDTDAVEYLRAPDGLRLDSDDRERAELEGVLATGGYDVVLADPLYKLHSGDSNDERQAVDLMRRLDGWREQYGFALVLPVHCRKTPPGVKFSLQEFFGSTAYLRGAEVVVGVQRVRAGYSFLHFFKDRDGDLPIGDRWGLLFDRDSGFRRDPDYGIPKLTAPERIRELLEAQPEMTQAQLMAATGYAERTVRDALRTIGAESKRPGPTGQRLFTVEPEQDSA